MDVWEGSNKGSAAGRQDPACRACGAREFRYLEGRKRTPVSLCGRNAVQLHDNARPLDLQALGNAAAAAGTVRVNEFALRLSVPKFEVTFFPDGSAIVKGLMTWEWRAGSMRNW